MAEFFLFPFTEAVLSKFSSLVLKDMGSTCVYDLEMMKLEDTLSVLKAVILDADEKQSKNHAVRNWLQHLKDVVYDIDDLVDDLSPKGSPTTNSQICGRISSLKKVRKFFSSSNTLAQRFKIGHRVKSLRKRLDDIAKDRKNFHFTEHGSIVLASSRFREQTHSFVRASDIIGRENDKEFIVQLLLGYGDQDNISVVPVVGIGGLGKTAVIKLAYNDSRVIQSFDLGMWVFVSEEFSVGKIVEKILMSATGQSFGHLDMDQMQLCLSDVLSDKKYLLVLDDVWNEDRNKWIDLMELLTNCRQGSKIIVTTRSKTVAKITGTIPPYSLSGLSNEDCLSLLLKCAFSGPNDWLPNLVELGKETVTKCGGVPLAVKTLGSLLYGITDEKEWLRVRDNDIWKIDQKQSDILPILRLSYEQLPFHLRQCFAYCSIFPKGFEVPREMFINLWIAQGFIQSTNGDRPLEEIGNQYFNELLSMFCFQDVVEAFDGEILACKIHSLVHDLAVSVAGAEFPSVTFDTRNISDRVRHIHFLDEDLSDKEVHDALHKFNKLRSLKYSLKVKPSNKNFSHSIITKFTYLRVLILTYLKLEELPHSIGDLKNLRYLDLSHNSNMRSLPKSICKLVNLQTLNLIRCENIHDLPADFGNLISLKTLYLTCQELSPRSKVDQSFSSLQFLLLYNCDFIELPSQVFNHFTSLRVLRIYDCQRLACLPNSINFLTNLEKLWIWNCDELDLCNREGFGGLKNLESLLLLKIPKLVSLPDSFKETDIIRTLKYLRVAECVNLTSLPEWMMHFTSLQRLYIDDCPNLSSLPERIHSHPAKVHISGCPNLGGIS